MAEKHDTCKLMQRTEQGESKKKQSRAWERGSYWEPRRDDTGAPGTETDAGNPSGKAIAVHREQDEGRRRF